MSFQVEKDGVGLKGVNLHVICGYRPSCMDGIRSIACVCVTGAYSFPVAKESAKSTWKVASLL